MLSFNSQSFQLFNVFRSLSLSFSVFYSFFYFFFFVYQSFLSTYKDIIGKLSIHHIMFFAYGSSQRKWKPFFAGCYFSFTHKQKKNFGLALLSLKSVLGKKLLCSHYDQISKYPIHLGLDYLQYHGNLLKNQVEQGFFLNIFIAIYDYLPIFF